jgi:hypothetical protein
MTTLQKFYYRNNFEYLERLRLSEQGIEFSRHTADPRAGYYDRELTFLEAVDWLEDSREQVTRIE